jgi:hypothetical protein
MHTTAKFDLIYAEKILDTTATAPVLREPDQPVMSPNIINTLKNKLINLLKNIFRFR